METGIISNSQISSNGTDKDQARLYVGTGTYKWHEWKLWVNVTLNSFYNITGISIQGGRSTNDKSKYYVKSYYVDVCFENPCEKQERIGKVWISFIYIAYHSFVLVCIESCKSGIIDILYMQSTNNRPFPKSTEKILFEIILAIMVPSQLRSITSHGRAESINKLSVKELYSTLISNIDNKPISQIYFGKSSQKNY